MNGDSPADNFVAHHTTGLDPTALPDPDDCCPICLGDYTNESAVRITGIVGCSHVFGLTCLRDVLASRPQEDKKCPLCRIIWIPSTTPRAVPTTLNLPTSRREPTDRPGRNGGDDDDDDDDDVTPASYQQYVRDIAGIRARARTTGYPREQRALPLGAASTAAAGRLTRPTQAADSGRTVDSSQIVLRFTPLGPISSPCGAGSSRRPNNDSAPRAATQQAPVSGRSSARGYDRSVSPSAMDAAGVSQAAGISIDSFRSLTLMSRTQPDGQRVARGERESQLRGQDDRLNERLFAILRRGEQVKRQEQEQQQAMHRERRATMQRHDRELTEQRQRHSEEMERLVSRLDQEAAWLLRRQRREMSAVMGFSPMRS